MPKFFNRFRSSWLKEKNKNVLQNKAKEITPTNSTITPTKSDNNYKTIHFPSFLSTESINDDNTAAIPAVSPTTNGNEEDACSPSIINDDSTELLHSIPSSQSDNLHDIRVISPANDHKPSMYTTASDSPVDNIQHNIVNNKDSPESLGPKPPAIEIDVVDPKIDQNIFFIIIKGDYKGCRAMQTGEPTTSMIPVEVQLPDGTKKQTRIRKTSIEIYSTSTTSNNIRDIMQIIPSSNEYPKVQQQSFDHDIVFMITKGVYKGCQAMQTGEPTTSMIPVEVQLPDGTKKQTRIRKTSVEEYCKNTTSNNTGDNMQFTSSMITSETALEGGIKRTVNGFHGILSMNIRNKKNENPSIVSTGSRSTIADNNKLLEPLDWFPNWKQPGTRISGRSLHKIVLFKKNRTSLLSDYKSPSFFDFLVRDQQLEKIVPLSSSNEQSFIPIEKEFTQHGITYALVGAKLDETKDNFNYNVQLRLIFVAIRGDETVAQRIVPFNPEESFNRLANFGALGPRKAKARLELLFTPSSALIPLDSSQFEEIEERGNVGCGYIPDALLDSILGCTAKSKRVIAIQVRIFSSKLGIFKGMLFRRPLITKIQLPPSMQKVGPSIVSDLNEEELKSVIMLITMNGQHPGDLNHYIHRHLNHDSKGEKPPPVSFEKKIKPLSEMIHHVWYGWGVSKSMCETYSKRARDRHGLKHAWVVGVSDCTKFLPSGHVFVTGMGHKIIANKVFVTRSPCTERADGRLLPIVTAKPDLMPLQYWDFLCQLHFGAIVFADPDVHDNGKITLSLPETINDGDLDGDLYFICWDAEILEIIEKNEEICPEIASMESTADIEVEPNVESVNNPGWLSQAQDIMTDLTGVQHLRELIGTLYSLHLKMAKENKEEDDIAFGRAYKKALELEKHGGKIQLPSHLHNRLEGRLQSFLAS